MFSVKCKLNFWTSFTIICLSKDVKLSDQSGIQIIVSNPGRQLCGYQVSVLVTCRPLRAARCSVSLTCRRSTTPLTVIRIHLRYQVLWAGDFSACTLHTIHGFKLFSLLPFSVPHNNDDDDDDDDNNNNNNIRQVLCVNNSLRPGLILWIPVWSFFVLRRLDQRFSTARPRPGTGPWYQLYRAARGSPRICHFSFLSNFHEYMFYSGNILRRKTFVNVSEKLRPRCWPEETTICYKISLVQWLITNVNVILCLSTLPHRVRNCTNTLYDYAIINY